MNPANGSNGSWVLTSWKDIANYLGKGVRTVQRWEQDFGLPVGRANGSNKEAVLARSYDLDMWIGLQCRTRVRAHHGKQPPFADYSLRVALASKMQTYRTLRELNCNLREELRTELLSLNATISTMCGDSISSIRLTAAGKDRNENKAAGSQHLCRGTLAKSIFH